MPTLVAPELAPPPTSARQSRPAAWLPSLALVAALLLALLPQAWVQLGTPGIIGLDGYFHIRFAELLQQAQAIAIPFPWLPTTILNPRDYTDHHLLFHLALIPFTFGNLIVGAKVAAVLFAAAATLVWYLIARAEGVRRPLLWLLLLVAASEGFLYRLSMTRRQSLTLLFLLVAVHLVVARRTRWLVPLGFGFVWLYDGWPVLLTVVGIALVGRWLEDRRIDLRPGLAAACGVALGISINPYFPNTVLFPIRHLESKLRLSSTFGLNVGSEWYAYTFNGLLQNAAVPLALTGLAVLISAWVYWRTRRFDARLVAWGGCALLFLGLLLNSRRFIEMEPAFAVMFAALAWTLLLERPEVRAYLARQRIGQRAGRLPDPLLLVLGTVGVIAWAFVPPFSPLHAYVDRVPVPLQAVWVAVIALAALLAAAPLRPSEDASDGSASPAAQNEDMLAGGPPSAATARTVRPPGRLHGLDWGWAVGTLFLIPLAASTISGARGAAADSGAPTYMSGAASWLAANSLPGERVFTTDWDDFPRVFYYDTRNVYLVGLDPDYMYQYDADLYLHWRSITRGEVPKPGADIRERYNCRWVLTDTQHGAFLSQARQDPRMRQVYADRDAVVFFVSAS